MTALALFRFDNSLRRRAEDADEQVHLTPRYVLEPVRVVLGGRIELDPCTTPENPVGADRFHAPPEDGAARPVVSGQQLLQPAVRRGAGALGSPLRPGRRGRCPRVVLLIPAHTDTRIWHETMATASSLLFIKGRVKLGIPRSNGRQVAASHPSALVGWNVDLRLAGELGTAGAAAQPRARPGH